ncbi:ubiquinone-dependent pyruvate dehydrogenase [Homoserinibacter sp. YIM 151385]|uniref:ubiquinone-dependent pyruvate dehydrogenase n=1 Tax=Homoserinibacter sp. YIM 151385 TaxID=2985506 RepID=UPI0022F0679A|nr:ubiquinone-dependent pyruvate dehydrogenase [Homoserinibacter sp. YIM 151385]WBU38327.1 ubiquinone-dependent pyruvate dehydrogenase [Homoserinibacter sp. YIM 151385]
MPKIAENLVRTLAANGVSRVWGVPGDSLNGVTDAIRTSEALEWMLVRHEESAAFAAGAEAEITGELAVCAGSCGPGNLHLVNGLYDANRSRVPVLAIAAHIPSAEIGSTYFQETHPTELFRECSVYCELVSTPAQMPRVLEIAMREAVERRGVAVIVIPGDLALAEAVGDRAVEVRRSRSETVPIAEELDRAAAILGEAKRVTILAGAGVAGARAEVLELADALAAPIVHALRGKEHIEHDNPYDVGMTGLLGFASGYRAMERCDTLLVLGSDLPYQEFYPDARIIQVDARGEQLGRRAPLELGLRGDVGPTIRALLPRLAPARSRKHLDSSVDHYRRTRERFDRLERQGEGPLHPQHVTAVLDELAADDAILIPDVGTPVVWAARHLHIGAGRRLLGSFAHGTMAAALPLAIGAQAVDPARQVIAMAGDGGLSMLLGELATAAQLHLPVKVVVYENSSLAFVEVEMKAAGVVNFATELENPDFAAVARACGFHAERVETEDELPGALRRALEADGPALVSVRVERQELSLPPSIEAQQAKGFSLYAMRTVLSGDAREVIDLAKANLRQLL